MAIQRPSTIRAAALRSNALSLAKAFATGFRCSQEPVREFASRSDKASNSLFDISKTLRSWDVDQGWLLPPSVHQFVAPGHLAHFVRDTVCEAQDPSAITGV
jgi:hypothetical protein